MIIEIDDDYKYIVAAAILKETRSFVKEILDRNDYFTEEDRIYHERLLAALNVVIADYCVEEMDEIQDN